MQRSQGQTLQQRHYLEFKPFFSQMISEGAEFGPESQGPESRISTISIQNSEQLRKIFFTNSPCNANARREASGRYCDAQCIRVACALFVCVCRKEIEVTICVRERERETMVRHLEISIEVTISGKERQWFNNWK